MLPKGHNISYGNTYKTKKETKVAIIPVGYEDGFCMQVNENANRLIDRIRNFASSTKKIIKKQEIFVEINQKPCKVLGQVGMYHSTIDITNIDAKVGDEVFIDVKLIYVDRNIRRDYI